MRRPLLFGITFLLSLGCFLRGNAQTDDLMIVEFVDWSSGSGFGIELYNPTGSDIDLATGYHLLLFFNGGSSPTNTAALSGIVPAGGTFIIGNSAYCTTNCPGTCDLTSSSLFGVNGNDAIVLSGSAWTGNIFTTPFVDMVGCPGWAIGANGTSQMVNGVPDALFQNRITRQGSNITRYTQFDGIYNNNAIPDSWPNDRVTNVIGWTVDPVGCIVPGFTTLPVEMAWFTGQGTDARTAELSWATFTESNNYGFTIERSAQAEGGFAPVGFVPGAGNTSDQQAYTFQEKNLTPGVHYYRLRQVDYDNAAQYSDVIAVQVYDLNRLVLYPNPAKDFTHFSISPGEYSLKLLNASGQLVLHRELDAVATSQPVKLDLSAFRPGIYHYVITGTNGNNYSGRLVKQ